MIWCHYQNGQCPKTAPCKTRCAYAPSVDSVIGSAILRSATVVSGEDARATRAAQAPAQAVPAGWKLVQTPITEAMHVAASKVLLRAHGMDWTPQRMLDAMLAAAPTPPAAPAKLFGSIPAEESDEEFQRQIAPPAAAEARDADLREALEIARDYVAAHVQGLREAYRGYPHRYARDEADLAKIDAALAAHQKGGGE